VRRIVWTPQARVNLQAIHAYVAFFNLYAAQRLATRLIVAAESLADFPERGRSMARGHRELVAIAPYRIRYFLENDDVVIVSVRHGAREPL
jgi:toxin ParE1/3/4